MNKLPNTGYLRVKQIVGDPSANPPIPALIPISESSWWKGVSSGRYPAAVKLGPRTTVWRVEDIRALIGASAAAVEQPPVSTAGKTSVEKPAPKAYLSKQGRDLRDCFAGQAMAALLANPKTDQFDVRDAPEWVASAAYEIADAMLIARGAA